MGSQQRARREMLDAMAAVMIAGEEKEAKLKALEEYKNSTVVKDEKYRKEMKRNRKKVRREARGMGIG